MSEETDDVAMLDIRLSRSNFQGVVVGGSVTFIQTPHATLQELGVGKRVLSEFVVGAKFP